MGFQELVKGWTGELQTQFTQAPFLDLKVYHVFNNVLLKIGERTTQIDHVIVSKYGIFVIETKKRNGYIYGKTFEASWTQVLYHKKVKFQNPLRQNYLHIKSLATVLNLDYTKMHSVIVFWGDCKFKTIMPVNVLNNNINGYIHSKKHIMLSDEEVTRCCQLIQDIKDSTSFLDG